MTYFNPILETWQEEDEKARTLLSHKSISNAVWYSLLVDDSDIAEKR
jgi:hypothetical protein